MSTPRLRALALACASLCGGPACLHVTHPAEVRPGLSIEVAGSATALVERTRAHPDPAVTELVPEVQLGLRYGVREGEDQGVLVSVVLPVLTFGEYFERVGAPESLAGAAVDVYYQAGGDPDWGVGLVAGFTLPRVYAMLGHGWRLGEGVTARLDGSLAAGLGFTIYWPFTPVFVHTVTARLDLDGFDVGLWGSATALPWGIAPGESYPDTTEDRFHAALSGGVLLGVRFPPPAEPEEDIW